MPGLKLSGTEIKQALADVNRWRQKALTVSKAGEKITERIVRTVEIGAAGFGLGMLKGKYGDVAPKGVPLSLLAGVGLHALGYLGVAGKHSEHLHTFADGALAVWGLEQGSKVGASMKGIGGMGELPGNSYSPPSDAEIARAAASV